MTIRLSLLALAFFAFITFTSSAYALDQLPVPPVSVTPVEAQVMEFASAELNSQYAKNCQHLLRQNSDFSTSQKIMANKAYRQCKAEAALRNLSVWSWQDARN